jgi:SAM-dependent methyltransferase
LKKEQRMPYNPYDNPGFSDQFNQSIQTKLERQAPRIAAFLEGLGFDKDAVWLMDLGCGAGHVVEYFYQAGYRVAGLDSSPYMMQLTRARFAEGADPDRVAFVEADVLAWDETDRYGFVYSIGQILNFLFEWDDLRKGVANIYRAMRPGGVLVFDFLSFDDNTEPYSYHNLTSYKNKTDIVFSSCDPHLGIQQVHRIIFNRETETGKFNDVNEMFTMRMFRVADLTAVLESAGFVGIYYTDFEHLDQVLPLEEIRGFKYCVCRKPEGAKPA